MTRASATDVWLSVSQASVLICVSGHLLKMRTVSVGPNAQSIPRSAVLEGKDVGEIKRAKDDGRLPMEDHNTRLVVIGGAVPARYVAEALAREAFHNVSYFAGSLEEARAALKP